MNIVKFMNENDVSYAIQEQVAMIAFNTNKLCEIATGNLLFTNYDLPIDYAPICYGWESKLRVYDTTHIHKNDQDKWELKPLGMYTIKGGDKGVQLKEAIDRLKDSLINLKDKAEAMGVRQDKILEWCRNQVDGYILLDD